jgi:hypothetical protein
MDESVETAVAQSLALSEANGLYCEECLRVNESFNDIPNAAIKVGDQVILSLKADVAGITQGTT